MNKVPDLLMDTSILYRSAQKYFDRMLTKYSINYAQLPILIMIYEQEGISLQKMVSIGGYDKGTVTKNVQKLERLGYVSVQSSVHDKRQKEVYTTKKGKHIMTDVYLLRKDWWKHVIQTIPYEKLQSFSLLLQSISTQALAYSENGSRELLFFDMDKISMTAYEGMMSTVLYTGGCNFQCPLCPKEPLIYIPQDLPEITVEDVLAFLDSHTMIKSVCIAGGEPFIHEGLDLFLMLLKSKGYKIKIFTNGSFDQALGQTVEQGLVDSVSISIKHCPKQYGKACGIDPFDVSAISHSLQILKRSHIDHEVTLNVFENLHTIEDIEAIGQWIQGCKRVIVTSQSIENKEMVEMNERQLEKIKTCLEKYVDSVVIREWVK